MIAEAELLTDDHRNRYDHHSNKNAFSFLKWIIQYLNLSHIFVDILVILKKKELFHQLSLTTCCDLQNGSWSLPNRLVITALRYRAAWRWASKAGSSGRYNYDPSRYIYNCLPLRYPPEKKFITWSESWQIMSEYSLSKHTTSQFHVVAAV